MNNASPHSASDSAADRGRRALLLAAASTWSLATLGCATAPAVGVIDAHVHLYDPSLQSHPWLDDVVPIKRRMAPEDYLAVGGGTVSKIVCVEAAPVPEQSFQEARWLQAAADRSPLIGAIVAQARIEDGAAVQAELDVLMTLKQVTGIRRIVGPPFQNDPDFILRPAVIEGLRQLPRFRLVFDLAGVSSANLDKAIQTVRRCPDTVFVLNHTGRPDIKSGALEPWRRQLRELAAMPNTYCKLSNLARDAGPEWTAKKVELFFNAAVEAFGFERLMFGTDFPVITLVPRGSIASSLGLMRELMAGASAGERARFFGGNAKGVYRVT